MLLSELYVILRVNGVPEPRATTTATTENERTTFWCTNCGRILTGMIQANGTVSPVGVGDDELCGETEFEGISADPLDPDGNS